MSNELNVCAHPENELPLRAYLLRERTMIEVGSGTCLELHSYRERLNVCQPGMVEMREYIIGSEAILLRPTGIYGLKTCERCLSEFRNTGSVCSIGCLDCEGTGHVTSPIYQADVVQVYGNAKPLIVHWDTDNAGWMLSDEGIPLTNGMSPIVICSLFAYLTTPKPDEVSDEQWGGFIGEQYKALLASLEGGDRHELV